MRTGNDDFEDKSIPSGGSGGGGGAIIGFSPKGEGAGSALEVSPHSVCLVVVDVSKKRVSVLNKEFRPFW